MAFGPQRGYSDGLKQRQIESMRAAAAFAHEIGHPLTLCIDINWTRTWLDDDPDGRALANLMELSRKWLKGSGVAVFAWISVRECPIHPSPRPNAHILLHCPLPLIASFEARFREAAARVCDPYEKAAIVFGRLGNGNPTLKAALGRLRYMSKGACPGVAKRLGITPEPQGRIYGKRVSISQDIHRAAQKRALLTSRDLYKAADKVSGDAFIGCSFQPATATFTAPPRRSPCRARQLQERQPGSFCRVEAQALPVSLPLATSLG